MAEKKKNVRKDGNGVVGLEVDQNFTLEVKALHLLRWASAMDKAMMTGDPLHMVEALMLAKAARNALMDAAMKKAGIQKREGYEAMFGEHEADCSCPTHGGAKKSGPGSLDNDDMSVAVETMLRNIKARSGGNS